MVDINSKWLVLILTDHTHHKIISSLFKTSYKEKVKEKIKAILRKKKKIFHKFRNQGVFLMNMLVLSLR